MDSEVAIDFEAASVRDPVRDGLAEVAGPAIGERTPSGSDRQSSSSHHSTWLCTGQTVGLLGQRRL